MLVALASKIEPLDNVTTFANQKRKQMSWPLVTSKDIEKKKFQIFVAFFEYTNFNVMFDLKDLLQLWSKLLFGLDSSSAETSKISNSSASSKLSSTIIK